MRVLIENEAGSTQKNTFDERTLKHLRSATVSRPYPYPYGFVIGTRSGDGDAVDCFVLTAAALKSGSIVDCAPVGLLEQVEDGEVDHKVLAAPAGETAVVDAGVLARLTEFVSGVFAHVPGKRMEIGRMLGPAEAAAYIDACGGPAPRD